MVNLDNGQLAFEERCSRATTERRVLRHLTRAGFSYPYDPNSHEQDSKFYNMRVQVYNVGMVATSLTGCAFETESKKVTYNMKQEAENFNVLRRFAVINTRTDKVEFEMIGAFSREDATDDQVTLVVEMEDGTYKRHIIGLNEDTMYVIEDLGGAEVNKYKYEVNYIPESIVPFEITDKK